MLNFSKLLFSSLRRPVFLYLTTLSLTLIFLFSAAFYWVEGFGVNPLVTHFFDAFYFSVSITTGVGLGDIHPVTRIGKLLTMGMMFLGTGLFVSFTGTLAASIMEVELEHLKHSSERDRKINL